MVKPMDYLKQLETSGLPPQARLVATVIALHRYRERLAPHAALPMRMPDLADACGMSSKNTARRWLLLLIAEGWIIAAEFYRDNRQQPNGYYLRTPDMPSAEVNRLTSGIEGSGGRLLRSSGCPISVKRLTTVVRSNNNGAADDAAHRGGGSSDEQGNPQPAERDAEPAPALGGADTEPAHVTEDAVLDEWQDEHRAPPHIIDPADDPPLSGPEATRLLDALGVSRGTPKQREYERLRMRRAASHLLRTVGE